MRPCRRAEAFVVFTNTCACAARSAAVAGMLLWLVLALADVLEARGGIQDDRNSTSYMIRVTSCPDVGYFFRRTEGIDSAGACYMCLCKNDGAAFCWQRQNRHCDVSSHQHNAAVAKRVVRVRRSPLGLGDVFFRDAARDNFNKNTPQTCKPFESSFSEGCPPDDWCVGCTVCDCDANGRWDCHILSFCPDKENKNIMRTAKKTINKQKSKSKVHYNKAKEALMKTTKRPIPVKPQKKQSPSNKQTKNTKPQNWKNVKNNNKASPKPLIVRKRIVKRKPVVVNIRKNQMKLNATDKEIITQEVVKRVMAMMQRLLNKSQMINKQLLTVLPSPRSVEKRSMNNPHIKSIVKKYKPVSSDKKRYKKFITQNKTIRPEARYTMDKQNNSQVKSSTSSYKKKLSRHRRDVNLHDVIAGDSTIKVPLAASKKMDDIKMIGAVHNKTYQDDSLKKDLNKYEVEDKKLKKSRLNSNNITYQNINTQNKIITEMIPLNNGSNFNNLETVNTSQGIMVFKHLINKPLSLDISKSGFNTTIKEKFKILKNNSNHISVNYQNVEQKIKSQSTDSNYNINRMMKNVSNSNEQNNMVKIKPLNKKSAQNVFKRLLGHSRKNNTIITSKSSRFNLMKYLRKLIKKIFSRKSKVVSNVTIIKTKHNKKIVEAICDIFRKCNPNQKNNKLLDLKINELNLQSHIILKSINIIKGLLHLIRYPSTPETGNDRSNFSGDMNKLNFILSGRYGNTFTDNQKIQIDYIKVNTQTFIDAVGKFVNILSEIIKILTQQPKTNKGEIRHQRNLNFDSAKGRRNVSLGQEVHDLKRLLVKYNLVQNTFMKKMYETLKFFEKAQTNTTESKVSLNNFKQNTSIAIERISSDVVKNLRKLKILADTLNSSSRRKRSIGQTDTVEYLLTLMEYLLKRNSPLDTAPVNDGIDLLIDAIRNAPDVEAVKNKVSSFTPINFNDRETTDTSFRIILDDDVSDDSHSFKEDNNTIYIGQHKGIERVSRLSNDNFRDYEEEVTNSYIKYQRDILTTQNPSIFFVTTLLNPEQTRNDSQNYIDNEKFLNKFRTEKGTERFEVFTDDSDDDEPDDATTVAPDIDSTIITHTVDTTPNLLEIKQFTATAIKLKNKGYGQVTLDWLDEGYDQYEKEADIKKFENVTNTPSTTTALTTSRVQNPHKQVDTVSGLTKEEIDEYDKRRLEKVKSEAIMHKKQIDLLNSLDYGTEKSEILDSKDDREDASIYY